jgi:hypothetical protein
LLVLHRASFAKLSVLTQWYEITPLHAFLKRSTPNERVSADTQVSVRSYVLSHPPFPTFVAVFLPLPGNVPSQGTG